MTWLTLGRRPAGGLSGFICGAHYCIPEWPPNPPDRRAYLLTPDGLGLEEAMAPIDYFMSIFCGMCIGLAGWAIVWS